MKVQQNIKRCFSLSVVVILLLGCVHVATPKSRKGPLTNAQRKEFLIAHNNFRRDVAKEFDGVKQPPAANMRRLYWSAGLEAEAVAWTARMVEADKLYYGNTRVKNLNEFLEMHGMLYPRFIGQNVKYGIDNPSLVVREWGDETRRYTLKTNSCVQKDACRQYIQMVWAHSNYLGCAIGQKEGNLPYVTCSYDDDPDSKAPYKEGENCTLCGVSIFDVFSACENGLCQPKDKCSPVKGCKVVDTENCLCSDADYNALVDKLVKANGLRLSPSSLLLVLSVVVVDLLVSPLDIA